MASEITCIPLYEPRFAVTLVFLCKYAGGQQCDGLMYLQGIRSGTLAAVSSTGDPENTAAARTYKAMLWKHTLQLATETEITPSAIASPPSRFPQHAFPYRAAFTKKFKVAVDLTERFSRSANVFSGEDANLEDIVAALSYKAEGDESKLDSLLIVDDVFSRGRTAAAMIIKLQAAGFPSCPITVVFPLWLPRTSV